MSYDFQQKYDATKKCSQNLVVSWSKLHDFVIEYAKILCGFKAQDSNGSPDALGGIILAEGEEDTSFLIPNYWDLQHVFSNISELILSDTGKYNNSCI